MHVTIFSLNRRLSLTNKIQEIKKNCYNVGTFFFTDRLNLIFFKKGVSMLSKIPLDLEKIRQDDLDKEILRAAIIAELDAINLYEQMASITKNKNIRTILLDVAKEEKTHVGEFQTLLLREDAEQVKELEEGKKEVDELAE